jgi:hypothetical protein
MECDFNIAKLIGNQSQNGISIIDGKKLSKYNQNQWNILSKFLDTIGNLSANVKYYLNNNYNHL